MSPPLCGLVQQVLQADRFKLFGIYVVIGFSYKSKIVV
jgi:hypothetical protein